MNPLEELHIRIDSEPWYVKDRSLLNRLFQEVNDKLDKLGEKGLLHKSDIERQTFALIKNPESKLSGQIFGKRKLEDGTEVDFEWPDIKTWAEADFAYIQSRFDACRNLYAKTEYGLLLYYSNTNHLKHNEDVATLLRALLDLARSYLEKALPNDDKDYYIIHFGTVLTNAFHIADSRKNDEKISEIYEQLIRFAAKVHNNWDVTHKSTLRCIIDLTDFAIQYKKEFEIVDLSKYLDQNFHAATELSKTYNWGAIYICEVSQKLADAIGDKRYDWQTFQAEQYEAMIQPNIASGNLAAISFVEKALEIYKKIGNTEKIGELSKRYNDVRNAFRFGQIREELPKDESDRIIEAVKKLVANNDNRQILEAIRLRSMYSKLDQIQKMADEVYSESSFSHDMPANVTDKYGNTVEVYVGEERKREFEFWQMYNLDFQVGTQTLTQLFLEAIKANKLSYHNVIEFLSASWIGNTYPELFNGFPYDVCPLDAIKPGFKLFFDEVKKWELDPNYHPDFICSTDSLASKSEYILRYFCKLAGIPTFKDKPNKENGHKVKNEKNVYDMLVSLKHSEENPTGFLEEDRKFIEFVLDRKMGLNLRHRVAHGLMDAPEYTIVNPILLLTVILILSTYAFERKQEEHDTSQVEAEK